jgi:hypothetical protein
MTQLALLPTSFSQLIRMNFTATALVLTFSYITRFLLLPTPHRLIYIRNRFFSPFKLIFCSGLCCCCCCYKPQESSCSTRNSISRTMSTALWVSPSQILIGFTKKHFDFLFFLEIGPTAGQQLPDTHSCVHRIDGEKPKRVKRQIESTERGWRLRNFETPTPIQIYVHTTRASQSKRRVLGRALPNCTQFGAPLTKWWLYYTERERELEREIDGSTFVQGAWAPGSCLTCRGSERYKQE